MSEAPAKVYRYPAREKAWRERNKPRLAAYNKARYEANVTEERAKRRAAYAANRDHVAQLTSERLLQRKLRVIEALGGKCVVCGFDHPAALQFHHRDPSAKSFEISAKVFSSGKKYPWEVVLAEAQKCDLLCANCHFLEHTAWEWWT